MEPQPPASEQRTVAQEGPATPPPEATSAGRGQTGAYQPNTPASSPWRAGTVSELVRGPGAEPASLGPYELLEVVARGGMGVVYRARHTALGRVVALKTLRDFTGDPDQRERFDREVRAAARLAHPNIVPIYEIGEHDGLPFFAMAFAEGGSLAQHRERYRADPRAAAALLEKVARAVHHAHRHGITHRDLKPGNIVLDAGGEPAVADFGLAKLHEPDVELTQTGQVLGTPAYMAPEQAAGRVKEVGPAADVWALGVILFELLAGRRPFVGDSAEDVKRRIRDEEPPTLRSLAPAARELEAVVGKCLRKDPAERYESAEALADDLARYLRGEAVSTGPSSRLSRLRRAVRRHPRRLAALVAAGLLAALVAAVVYLTRPVPPEDEIRARLARGEAVTLIGPKGLPAYWRWVVGGGNVEEDHSRPDHICAVDTFRTGLLELVPGPLPARYLFRAEVRHLDMTEPHVGLYFGYRRQQTSVSLEHSCATLTFVEAPYPPPPPGVRGPPELFKAPENANLVMLVLERFQESGPFFRGLDAGCVTPCVRRFTVKKGNPWRALAVKVAPEGVEAFWEGEPIRWGSNQNRHQLLTRAELTRLAAENLSMKTLPELDPARAFGADGGIGLFIERGAALFRNVVVEPLP